MAKRPALLGGNGSAGAKRVRCAIYTRKSTEEGLDQAFTVLLLRRSMLTEKIARRGQHITRECSIPATCCRARST